MPVSLPLPVYQSSACLSVSCSLFASFLLVSLSRAACLLVYCLSVCLLQHVWQPAARLSPVACLRACLFVAFGQQYPAIFLLVCCLSVCGLSVILLPVCLFPAIFLPCCCLSAFLLWPVFHSASPLSVSLRPACLLVCCLSVCLLRRVCYSTVCLSLAAFLQIRRESDSPLRTVRQTTSCLFVTFGLFAVAVSGLSIVFCSLSVCGFVCLTRCSQSDPLKRKFCWVGGGVIKSEIFQKLLCEK